MPGGLADRAGELGGRDGRVRRTGAACAGRQDGLSWPAAAGFSDSVAPGGDRPRRRVGERARGGLDAERRWCRRPIELATQAIVRLRRRASSRRRRPSSGRRLERLGLARRLGSSDPARHRPLGRTAAHIRLDRPRRARTSARQSASVRDVHDGASREPRRDSTPRRRRTSVSDTRGRRRRRSTSSGVNVGSTARPAGDVGRRRSRRHDVPACAMCRPVRTRPVDDAVAVRDRAVAVRRRLGAEQPGRRRSVRTSSTAAARRRRTGLPTGRAAPCTPCLLASSDTTDMPSVGSTDRPTIGG